MSLEEEKVRDLRVEVSKRFDQSVHPIKGVLIDEN